MLWFSTELLLLGIPILTILAFGWEVRRRLREDVGSIWWIRMGAVTGLLAIAFQSMGEFSLQMPGNAAWFAVVAGLAIHDGRRNQGASCLSGCFSRPQYVAHC